MLVWVQKAPHVAKKEQGKPLETSLTREYRALGPERSYLSQIVIFRNAKQNSCEVIKTVKDKSWFNNWGGEGSDFLARECNTHGKVWI